MNQPDLFNRQPEKTLAQAKAETLAGLDEGVACPCCGQYARRYRRKLSAEMALAAIAIHAQAAATGREWVNIRTITALRGGNYAKLAYWGLAEPAPPDVAERIGQRSGWWRLTQLGRLFVLGEAAVPSHAVTYNGEVEGLAGPDITIQDALGTRFSYDELMGTTTGPEPARQRVTDPWGALRAGDIVENAQDFKRWRITDRFDAWGGRFAEGLQGGVQNISRDDIESGRFRVVHRGKQ